MNGVEHLIQLVFVCTFEWDIRICSGGIVSALFTLVVVMLVFIKDYCLLPEEDRRPPLPPADIGMANTTIQIQRGRS